MKFQYYNAHPKGLFVDDCVKRAITVATGADYMEIQRQLNRHKKITGARAFNERYNPHSYIETVWHAQKVICYPDAQGRRPTVREFVDAHPKGAWICDVCGHWTVFLDGTVYDTFDVSERTVYVAWRIT